MNCNLGAHTKGLRVNGEEVVETQDGRVDWDALVCAVPKLRSYRANLLKICGKCDKDDCMHCKWSKEHDNNKGLSSHHRWFCDSCASYLFAWSALWKELIHPFAR
jgi:hypothetical protein